MDKNSLCFKGNQTNISKSDKEKFVATHKPPLWLTWWRSFKFGVFKPKYQNTIVQCQWKYRSMALKLLIGWAVLCGCVHKSHPKRRSLWGMAASFLRLRNVYTNQHEPENVLKHRESAAGKTLLHSYCHTNLEIKFPPPQYQGIFYSMNEPEDIVRNGWGDT